MRKLVLIGVSILLLGLGACQPGVEESTLDEDVVVAQIESEFDQFKQHLNRGEYQAALSFYADDPRFVIYEDGQKRYTSRDQIAAAYAQLKDFGPVESVYSDPEITLLSADLATLGATFTTTIGDPAEPSFSFSGIMLALLQRTPEGWVILQGHSSTLKAR